MTHDASMIMQGKALVKDLLIKYELDEPTHDGKK